MTDHANELRRHVRKLGTPAGDTPSVMAAAAAHIDAQAAEIERMKTALEQIAKNGESEWIDMNVKTARKAIGVSND
jgi:uncharacterized protein (DUF305 family)